MGADQISEIAPAIREVLSGGGRWCATLEVSGDPSRWVQFTSGTINASYPHEDAPEERFGRLDQFVLVEWKPNKYAQFELEVEEARAIANWIDRYFVEVLGCEGDYSIDATLEELGS
jgi:hypothetical protein